MNDLNLLSMSFLSAGLRDSEISGSSSRIWSINRSISVLQKFFSDEFLLRCQIKKIN